MPSDLRLSGIIIGRRSRNSAEGLLVKACGDGNLSAVQALVARHPDLNCLAFGRTPLTNAARKGHLGIVDLLLNAGANVNCEDAKAKTPLIHACEKGHSEISTLLSKRGANANHQELSLECRHSLTL